MQTLKNWTAKRSGGMITINGVDDETGGPIKLTSIDKIERKNPSAGCPTAYLTDGTAVARLV